MNEALAADMIDGALLLCRAEGRGKCCKTGSH